MKYKLIKDWESKRHNKTIKKGSYVVILKNELEELIESGCIDEVKKTPKKKEKKEKNKKETENK